MADRPRFFDDLAGVAGGAFSALAGMRDEVEATVRARVDEAIRRFDLVRREDLEAVQDVAAAAQAAQERLEARLATLESRLAALEGGAPGASSGVAGTGSSPHATDGTEVAPAAAPPAMSGMGTPQEPPMVD